MDIIEKARMLRATIENLSANLNDEDAINNVELFPEWSGDGIEYSKDDRRRYGDKLYRCLQSHTSQATWNPVDAASLWAVVLIPDPEVIPVWVQPDSTNPYMKGDKVYYPDENGKVYESTIDNNVWSPDTYPAGWNEVV